MDGDTDHSDVHLCAKLVTTSEPVSGTTIGSSIGSKNDNPSSQLRHSKRKHDARGQLLATRECGEDENTAMMTGIDSFDDLTTADPPPKRARFAEKVAFRPKTDPSTQHTAILEPVHISRQIPSAPQQRLPPTSQPTQPLPAQDMQEQSRQIHRILRCPPDAYFDILSLANGTDRLSLVEMSWLDLSYLVHPRRCSFPEAVKALRRVNDAYSWIQNHPGASQPHVAIPKPPPYLAQDAPSALAAWLALSTPAKRIIEGPQQPRSSSSRQTQFTQQQSESRRGTPRPFPRGRSIKAPQLTPKISRTQIRPAPQQPGSHPIPRFDPSTRSVIEKEPHSCDNSGSQTYPAPQQLTPQKPELRPHGQTTRFDPSGHATKESPSLESPSAKMHGVQSHLVHRDDLWKDVPPLTSESEYPARPSSHIYSRNGKPTIRPAVGWQFWSQGGETKVWWDRRWRDLIQSRLDFEGVYVDERGWIMPILSSYMSESKRMRTQKQAKFEFNTHP